MAINHGGARFEVVVDELIHATCKLIYEEIYVDSVMNGFVDYFCINSCRYKRLTLVLNICRYFLSKDL